MKKQMAGHDVGQKKKKKHMVAHGGDNPYLPEEIIINILKRLPVKILIRFQTVCKYWKNLLKSPSFIANHLHHPSNYRHPSLVLDMRSRDDPLSLFVVDCEMHAIAIHKPPFTRPIYRPLIIGTCDGLICVRSTFSLFLWNPVTREVKRVPGVIDHANDGDFYFGFGSNPIVNDYKIVKILKHHEIKEVEVYSLKTDSWRKIQFQNIEFVRKFVCNVSANGSIFWYVRLKMGIGMSGGIVSFDTATEMFTSILMQDLNKIKYTATVYDKKLVLLCEDSSLQFCVMEEQCVDEPSGKKWSWMKIHKSSPYLSKPRYKLVDGVYESVYIESLVSLGNIHRKSVDLN